VRSKTDNSFLGDDGDIDFNVLRKEGVSKALEGSRSSFAEMLGCMQHHKSLQLSEIHETSSVGADEAPRKFFFGSDPFVNPGLLNNVIVNGLQGI
jgi:hypothetical protein